MTEQEINRRFLERFKQFANLLNEDTPAENLKAIEKYIGNLRIDFANNEFKDCSQFCGGGFHKLKNMQFCLDCFSVINF